MLKLSSYIFDGGNSQWKAVAGNLVHSDKRPEHVTVAHALAEIPPADYDYLSEQGEGEVCKISYTTPQGKKAFTHHYAFGSLAIRKGAVNRQRLARYTPDYLGVANAIMISHLYKKDHEYDMVALYAPVFRDQKETIKSAFLGTWEIERLGKTIKAKITNVRLLEEIVGGLNLHMIDPTATRFLQSTEKILMIDVGGGTTELAVIQNGKVLWDSIQTLLNSAGRPVGINNILSQFRSEVMRNKRVMQLTQDSFIIDNQMLAEAFLQTVLYVGNEKIELASEFDRATRDFITSLAVEYRNGNHMTANRVLLTGGGGYTLQNHLMKPLLRQDNTLSFIDESLRDTPHLANAYGARRLNRIMQHLGKISRDEEGE